MFPCILLEFGPKALAGRGKRGRGGAGEPWGGDRSLVGPGDGDEQEQGKWLLEKRAGQEERR